MREAASKKPPECLKALVEDSHATAKELIKDAATLKRQAAFLQEKAGGTRAEAREVRKQAQQAATQALLTIPEAALSLHVSERTLRHLLLEPAWQTRLVERTHKVGIYYKFIPLLPPNLMDDLTLHMAAKKPQSEG